MATELAITTEKVKPKVSLLSEYADYAQVFSKEVTNYVPPSCPYNHKINLNDSFVPKIGKIYPLSPDKKKATEDFLKEKLAARIIHSSNSSQVPPSFFVKKKDSKLYPCQDYYYLNKHTTHNAYPLPLISNLIDKLKDVCHFTKFDVCWSYNNVHIKDSHQWKAAFITHKGLFEPTIMFFGLCNSPTTLALYEQLISRHDH